MRVKYHSYNEIELEPGDMIEFQTVYGNTQIGTIINIEHQGFPRNLTYLQILTRDSIDNINTNLIFRCKKVIESVTL